MFSKLLLFCLGAGNFLLALGFVDWRFIPATRSRPMVLVSDKNKPNASPPKKLSSLNFNETHRRASDGPNHLARASRKRQQAQVPRSSKGKKNVSSLPTKPVANQTINHWKALEIVRRKRSAKEINDWMFQLVEESSSAQNIPSFEKWSIKSQIEFVKVLQEKKAYQSIMIFLQNTRQPNVKVCTTAIFAMALAASPYRKSSLEILDLMDRQGVQPTSLTCIAILGAVDGPTAASRIMNRLEAYKSVNWTAEIFNSAIYACRRVKSDDEAADSDWQTALHLLQKMRRKRLHPTLKTYHALLQVLSRTGKVQMAKSVIQQLQDNPDLDPDDRVWAAAINVCAEAADYESAIYFLNTMQASGHRPNLLHCSALLKAFAHSSQDRLAIYALKMMMDEPMEVETTLSEQVAPRFYLPVVRPDLVALNTVIKACAKSGNLEAAMSALDRLKRGDFIDPKTGRRMSPDHISYHSILVACTEPEVAKGIVKEMRFSRRSRYGAVPPNSVTYAHAINVCQQAKEPDLGSIEIMLAWAADDRIQPTVYMFAPAIWAAQKSGNRAKALEFFVEMENVGCQANEVAYNGVLSALCDNRDVDHAILIYEEMKVRGLCLNVAGFKRLAVAIQSIECTEERQSSLEKVLQLMDPVEKRVSVGGPIFESMITLYGTENCIDEALHTFNSINGEVDAPCLRAILLGCSLSEPPRWQEAVSILHTSDIVEGSIGPAKIDQIALGSAIIACSKANEFQEALTLLKLYGRGKPRNSSRDLDLVQLSPVAMNSLIAACGRGGRPDLALQVLSVMKSRYGVEPDTRSYRCAVIACNKAEHDLHHWVKMQDKSGGAKNSKIQEPDDTVQWWECALSLLRRMREENLIPDVTTYSAAISACEAAGEWQRALGVLQMMIDDDRTVGTNSTLLNLYCFNAAISACEKGEAWVEALELYERMLDSGEPIRPNVITLNSLLVALENAGQKELAQSMYREAYDLKLVNPWKRTRNEKGEMIEAMDLHRFSAAMAAAAIRDVMESYRAGASAKNKISDELVVITGKGLNSIGNPVLQRVVQNVLLEEYALDAKVIATNHGRIVVERKALQSFVDKNSW